MLRDIICVTLVLWMRAQVSSALWRRVRQRFLLLALQRRVWGLRTTFARMCESAGNIKVRPHSSQCRHSFVTAVVVVVTVTAVCARHYVCVCSWRICPRVYLPVRKSVLDWFGGYKS